MQGELLSVWERCWPEIWQRLADSGALPPDFFIQLVSDIAKVPKEPLAPPPPPQNAFDADGHLVDEQHKSRLSLYERDLATYQDLRSQYESALSSEAEGIKYFQQIVFAICKESDAVRFVEQTYEYVYENCDMEVVKLLRSAISEFFREFNLRYQIRGNISLHPTLPGVFSKLFDELKVIAAGDSHIGNIVEEFEEAFADLRTERSQARIKTCLQKQFNMLEALGSKCPQVTQHTLGRICEQIDWPHVAIKEMGKSLYKFGCDYPGVRHGGNQNAALRDLETKDLISLSLILLSYTPYFAHQVDCERCYTA